MGTYAWTFLQAITQSTAAVMYALSASCDCSILHRPAITCVYHMCARVRNSVVAEASGGSLECRG